MLITDRGEGGYDRRWVSIRMKMKRARREDEGEWGKKRRASPY